MNNLSRKKIDGGERSAVAAAAYISGKALWNEREQRYANFQNRKDVVHSELLAPDDAPAWAQNREQLWNHVEATARRKDARLAKTIEAAIARNIPRDQWVNVLRDFVAPYVAAGMVADIAIHDDGTGHNPHVHVLLTVRSLKPNGFGPKIPDVDQKNFVAAARRGWETISNTYLAAAGSSMRLDRRSFKARGIAQEPTKHRGPNQAERRQKREFARVHRELREEGMTKPPREELTPVPEKQAHNSAQRENPVRPVEQSHPAHQASPKQEQPWYQSAVERAREEAGVVAMQSMDSSSLEADLARRHEAYERTVLERAKNMPATVQEQELMTLAGQMSPDMQARVHNIVIAERMQHIRSADDTKRLAKFEHQLEAELQAPYAAYRSSHSADQEQSRLFDADRAEDTPERERE